MKKFLASLVLLLLALFGWATIAGACSFFWYQPEMPQKPQK
jgi:cyclic lactone autoinducer peptide